MFKKLLCKLGFHNDVEEYDVTNDSLSATCKECGRVKYAEYVDTPQGRWFYWRFFKTKTSVEEVATVLAIISFIGAAMFLLLVLKILSIIYSM